MGIMQIGWNGREEEEIMGHGAIKMNEWRKQGYE
jgi:hypothetical protein